MRKFISLALTLIMILSLAACGTPAETTGTPSTQDTDPIDTPEVTDPADETTGISGETEPTDETNAPETTELAFTEVNETVYVYGTEVLNVRKEPSAQSEKMGEMKEGEQVTRLGYNAEWSKISYYGNTYYASSDYLTTHAPLEFQDKTDTVYIIAEGTLYLRKKPAASADAVAYLPYGTKLDRTGVATTEDEFGTVWSRLLYNGQVCYASTTHLSTEEPTNEFDIANETVYIVKAIGEKVVEALNLRATPSLTGNIVKSVPAGTALTRIGIAKEADAEGIVWSKVIYNNITCYASSNYLTTEAPDDSTAEGAVTENADDFEETTNAAN